MFDVETIGEAVNDRSMTVMLGSEKLCFMHLVYAHPAIISCLSLAFKIITLLEYVPEHLGFSVVNPIEKLYEIC